MLEYLFTLLLRYWLRAALEIDTSAHADHVGSSGQRQTSGKAWQGWWSKAVQRQVRKGWLPK